MSMEPEFAGLKGTYTDQADGIFSRMRKSWTDMEGVTRRLIDEAPSEGRLIFYLVMSDLIFFLSWTFKTVIFPAMEDTPDAPLVVGIWLLIALMVRTGMFYCASVIVWIMCKGVGGEGNWRDTKAGMFWGSLVSAPFGFLAALVTVVLLQFDESVISSGWAVVIPFLLAMVPFVWYISSGVSAAHKFTQSYVLFTVLSIVTFGIIVALIIFNLESLA
ncbi:MAG: YIP1 family protein [Pseudomonadota bacterium]